ncbi:hypothetical protein AVEN_125681-1 [Araneus ventricosus]|uniref:Uncharacterized protein n=1 Tax=Araneus ventricosus TaxID=182803 RepID=A0A4Y2PSN0_ARAVE|nr:hypothetical protein AVEN_125681-1 [Araneus ventricosus]
MFCSIRMAAKPTNRFWDTVDRKYVLTDFSLEELASTAETVTGSVGEKTSAPLDINGIIIQDNDRGTIMKGKLFSVMINLEL